MGSNPNWAAWKMTALHVGQLCCYGSRCLSKHLYDYTNIYVSMYIYNEHGYWHITHVQGCQHGMPKAVSGTVYMYVYCSLWQYTCSIHVHSEGQSHDTHVHVLTCTCTHMVIVFQLLVKSTRLVRCFVWNRRYLEDHQLTNASSLWLACN